MRLACAVLLSAVFLMAIPNVFAAYYGLSYETAGLDTWNTSTLITRGDDVYLPVTLPWTFTFFNKNYQSINLDTNGYIEFFGINLLYLTSEYRFRQNVMIAPLG